MATIQPPTYRNIGSPVRAEWDFSKGSVARVASWPGAAFDAVVGGETFDVTRDGVTHTVALTSTATTRALVVAAINGTSGLSGVATDDTSNQCIRLQATTSIRVDNISDTTFAKVGLPELTRDRAVTNALSPQVPINVLGDEVECISSPITVPAGANRASIAVTIDNLSTNRLGVDFAIGWANGVEGESITSLFDCPRLAVLSGSVANGSADETEGYQKAYDHVVQQVGSMPSTKLSRTYEVSVPPGATKLYVVMLTCRSEGTAPPPRFPPLFSATVCFGAR